jgi:hypothetical protein
MPDVLVTKVGLQRPCVVSLIDQRITAGVPEHVRVCFEVELGLAASAFDHLGKAYGGERRTPLRGVGLGDLGPCSRRITESTIHSKKMSSILKGNF